MNYESWRIGYQSSEQAARSAFQSVCELEAEINRLKAGLTEIAKNYRLPVDDWSTQKAREILSVYRFDHQTKQWEERDEKTNG